MVNIVGVRFKAAGKIYNFSPAGIDLKKEDYVIVETIRGVELGQIVIGPRDIPIEDNIAPLKDIIRKATKEDIEKHAKNDEEAKAGIPICEEKIADHNLDMNIIDAEYTFDKNKIIFYFTAEGRVDFRELVRDLASIFRTRIELRQIGVRDEAKALGGIGSCGNHICCKRFLGEFEPVTIKMAKDQDLSLNPGKISGVCGRLMCCLNYENHVYEEKLSRMPDIGTIVETPNGRGIILSTETLTERVRVRIKLEDDLEDIETYNLSELKLTKAKDPKYAKIQRKIEENPEIYLLEEE